MSSTNDVTGDALVSKKATDAYRDGWDRIFGKKVEAEDVCHKPVCDDNCAYPGCMGPLPADSNVCETCGKWKGAHGILPGQPTDSLCFCPRLVNGQWEGRPIADLAADRPDDFAKVIKGLEDGTIQFS